MSSEDDEWTRSKNLQADMIRILFAKGEFYDCTFRVYSEQTGERKVCNPRQLMCLHNLF